MGDTVGNYELLDRVGQGGMGEVWRARHRGLGGLVAVKLLRPEAGGEGGAAELHSRFQREARVAAGLRSPHAIRVLDAGTAPDGRLWQAMELLDGLDLQQLVERFGPVPAARTVALLRQAAEALAEAHGQGLVHRDVKPSNLFLVRGGPVGDFVKVLDFGLARHQAAGQDTVLTRTGVIPGSPAYLAPEVLRGEAPSDRADVYALGCVAWWLLLGRLVFDARGPLDLVVAHLERTPPPLDGLLPGLPPGLGALVGDCLRKDPAARPGVVELGQRLATISAAAPWSEASSAAWWSAALPTGSLLPPVGEAASAPTPRLPAELGAAREAAWSTLKQHYEASRIDLLEFERRSALARRAADAAEVGAALQGLPVIVAVPEVLPAPAPAPAPVPELPAPAPAQLPAAPAAAVVAVLGGTSRHGLWAPEGPSKAVAVLGNISVDLALADLKPGMNELKCVAVFGGITVRVPHDLYVESAGVGVVGGFECHGRPPRAPEPGAPWLRVSGAAVFGSVEIEVQSPPDPRLERLKAAGLQAVESVIEGVMDATGRRRPRG